MEKDHDNIIHVLRLTGVYDGNHYPFKYTCIIKYCRGELQLEYPLNWKSERETKDGKCTVKIGPVSSNFKDKQLTLELADLLNCGFSSRILNFQKHIADYRAIVDADSVNISQDSLMNAANDLLVQFETEIGSLNQFFHQNAFDLLRDELITNFYNRYNKGVVEVKTNYHVVTATYLNDCVSGIMKFIDPLLMLMTIRRPVFDIESFKKSFEEKLRKFLLTKITSCTWIREIVLVSPLEEISDSLSFLEQSCAFLHEYRKELDPFTSDEKLEICVRLFSVNSVEENYHSFCREWSKIRTSYGEDMIDTLSRMQYRMGSEESTDFHRYLSRSIKFLKPPSQTIPMNDFSSVVFLVLLEMIRKGDASQDSKHKNNNTYIIRCQNCGRFFVPKRSDVIYCNRTAPGYDRPCTKVGPKQEYEKKRAEADKERDKIEHRISRRISYAGKNLSRAKKLRDRQLIWQARECGYREQLDADIISAEKYINLINDAANELFPRKL